MKGIEERAVVKRVKLPESGHCRGSHICDSECNFTQGTAGQKRSAPVAICKAPAKIGWPPEDWLEMVQAIYTV